MKRNVKTLTILGMFLVIAAITLAEDRATEQLKQRRARQMQQLKQDTPPQQNRNINPERIRGAMQKARQEGDKEQIKKIQQHINRMKQQNQNTRRPATAPKNDTKKRPMIRGRGMAQGFGQQQGAMQGRRQGGQNRPQRPMMQGIGQGRRMAQGFRPQQGQMQDRKRTPQRMMQGQGFGQRKGAIQGRGQGRQNRPQRPMMQRQMQGKGRSRGMGQGFGPQQGAMQGRGQSRQNRPQGPTMQRQMQGKGRGRGMGQRLGQGQWQNRMQPQAPAPFGNRQFRF